MLLSLTTYAQSSGINTKNPQATLDVVANNSDGTSPEGILVPRLTGNVLNDADTANVYGVSQDGMLAFVTQIPDTPTGQTSKIDSRGYYYFDAPTNKWIKFYVGATGDNGGIIPPGPNEPNGSYPAIKMGGSNHLWMQHNMGAVYTIDPSTEISAELLGAYYQWGQKESLVNGLGQFSAVTGWKNHADITTSWYSGADDIKTDYDPCPDGYRVPLPSDFQILLNTTYNTMEQVGVITGINSSSTVGNTNYTAKFIFTNVSNPTKKIYFPAAGLRSSTDGSLSGRGGFAFMWSRLASNISSASNLSLGSTVATINDSVFKIYGYSVRCISIDEYYD